VVNIMPIKSVDHWFIWNSSSERCITFFRNNFIRLDWRKVYYCNKIVQWLIQKFNDQSIPIKFFEIGKFLLIVT